MVKKFMFLLLMVLMVGFVFADSFVGINVDTDEDMVAHAELSAGGDLYFSTNVESGGDLNYFFDGLDFDRTIYDLYSKPDRGLNDMDVAKLFSYSMDIVRVNGNGNGNGVELHHSPRDEELIIAGSLDSAFISHSEGQYLLDLIQQLSIRVEALERTLEEVHGDSYCDNKISVIKDYGLPAVACDDTTFYNQDWGVVGIIELETEEEELVVVNESVCPEGKILCGDGVCRYVCVTPASSDYSFVEVCGDWSECIDGVITKSCHSKGYVDWYDKTEVCLLE